MEYTVADEHVFLAATNPKKAFAIHKLRFDDGREEFRIGYYMIAQRPRLKGKWAWGQFAPMMTRKRYGRDFQAFEGKGMDLRQSARSTTF